MIKAVIFDLDDTLYDGNSLTEIGLRQAVLAMIELGLRCTLDEGYNKIREIVSINPQVDRFCELANFFGCSDEKVIMAGYEKYINSDFESLEIYPETKDVLSKLSEDYKLVLVSKGSVTQQHKKIDVLGVRDFFDYFFIDDSHNKESHFNSVLDVLKLDSREVLVVGDRLDNEIASGNRLGMQTCRLLKGKYSKLVPREESEVPNYTIYDLRGLYKILNLKNSGLKIVTIGGGTGTSSLLEGLKKYTDNITAIVNVTDTGRSSGVIRKDFDMLAPGDARNCLIALSNSEELLCDLFQYRMKNGGLEGYSFGNLFIAALKDLTGSFESAIEEASRILQLKGRVLPSTFDNIHVCAELKNGKVLNEENEIIDRHNENVHLRSPIKRVFHKPLARANNKTIEAIKEADLIVLCPGSLYTSIISNLLVEGVSEAVNQSNAKKVYVCNIMSQVSQTYGYKASDHVKKIKEYLMGDLNYVILNNKLPNEELIRSYLTENAHLVENDVEEIRKLGVEPIECDLLDEVKEKKLLWEKKNLLRHDPDKIAEVLVKLV